MHCIRCFGPYLFASCVVGPVEKITITIATLHHAAVFVANALHHNGFTVFVALDIERATGPHCHSPFVDSAFEAKGYRGANHVPGGKPMHALVAHQVAPWKAKFIQARALVAASACAFERQCGFVPVCDVGDRAYAGGVECMCLGYVQACAVELGLPSTGGHYRQAGGFQGGQ